MVKRLNTSSTDDLMNIKRLTFNSYFTNILISGLELSVIVNYDESVDYVSKEMKKNLGLIKEKDVTMFDFDINESYNLDEVKFNKLSSDLVLFPNFVGKTLREAKNYCNRNNLRCEGNIDDELGTIVSQSVGANTDVATIRGKTIKFEIIEKENKKPTRNDNVENKDDSLKKDDLLIDNNSNNNDDNNNNKGSDSDRLNDNTNDTNSNLNDDEVEDNDNALNEQVPTGPNLPQVSDDEKKDEEG